MGYTHYWKRYGEHDETKWKKFTDDVKHLLGIIDEVPFFLEKRILLAGETDDTPPVVTEDEVIINGKRPNDCEHFFIQKETRKIDPESKKYFMDSDVDDFSFCKTRCEPYDLVVVAVLCLYKYHFGNSVEISSDGDERDLEEGINLVNKVFSYGIPYRLVVAPRGAIYPPFILREDVEKV
jgi:hypothetical protein